MGRSKTRDKHLPKRMRLSHGAYYYVANEKWIRLSDSFADALTKWAEYEGGTKIGTTVAHAIDRYVIDIVPRLALSTQKEYRRMSGRLRVTFGKMQLSEVRKPHIAQYLDQHPSASSANKEINMLTSVYKYAVRWGWCSDNPCTGVERNAEKARDRYVQDTEYVALRTFCWTNKNELGVKPWQSIAIAMDLSYLTGFRQRDVLNLQVGDVDEQYIKIREGKTGWRARSELSDELREVLERAKTLRHRVTSFNIINQRDGKPYSSGGFKSAWQRMILAALDRGVITERFTFHDIRAKHATDRDEQGLNAQLALGHPDAAMTARYIRHRLGRIIPALKTKIPVDY